MVKINIQAAKSFFYPHFLLLTTCSIESVCNLGRISGTCKLVCQFFQKKWKKAGDQIYVVIYYVLFSAEMVEIVPF
jgi:hypothetical protein